MGRIKSLATMKACSLIFCMETGPAFNGSSPETGLPVSFSKTENVKWLAPLPGKSPATPVAWGDHVFVSSIDDGMDGLMAICLDHHSGKELWRKQIGVCPNKDERSNRTGPSPVTDGRRVVFYYGTGDLACFYFAGGVLWKKSITKEYGNFAYQWTVQRQPDAARRATLCSRASA